MSPWPSSSSRPLRPGRRDRSAIGVPDRPARRPADSGIMDGGSPRHPLVCPFHGRSPSMVDLIKKAFYTGLGLAVLTKEKAEEMIKDIAEQAKLSEHEGKELVDGLMKQSDQARQDFQTKLDEAVLAVVKRLHLATRDEV